MPPRNNITQDDWDHHKAELSRLYLEEGKSLDKIKTEMREKYNFCPSKSQYETAFKKWNFRKNLTGSDWKFVSHRTEKRKVENKESNVYLNGILIPAKKVKKELDRYFTPCYQQPYNSAPSPQTPPYITVGTPHYAAVQSPAEMTVPDILIRTPHYLAAQTPRNSMISEIRSDSLPWFQFQSFLESQAHVVAQISHAGNYRVRPPLFDFPKMITSTVWASGSSVQQDLSREQLGSVESFMQAISLERNPGDFHLSIQKLLGPFNCDALTEFLRYMAYLSSNNMLSSHESGEFLEWVIATKNHSALEAFLSVKITTINAFARCLFESALQIWDKDVAFRNGKVPIRDAAVLRILLKAGVDPSLPLSDGTMPLHNAVSCCDMELARILLDERVDVNIRTGARRFDEHDIERTALSLAASIGNVEMVQMLLDAGADTEIRDCDVYDFYIGAGSYFGTALERAATAGNVELVRLLLDAGADINARAPESTSGWDRTVLQNVAAESDFELSIKLARLLLQAGANVNAPSADTVGPLRRAASSGHAEIVQMLLRAGAVVNDYVVTDDGFEWPVLVGAAMSGSVATVRALLDAGADVNACTDYDQSGLQIAAYRGHVEMVRMLLDAGAAANDYIANRWTTLLHAAQSGSVATFRVLLNAGADADVRTQRGTVALGFAVLRCETSAEIVRELLNAVADIKGPASSCGGRELQLAVWLGKSIDIVRGLLEAGANVNFLAGRYDDSVLQIAVSKGSSIEIVRALLEAGADVNVPPSRSDGSVLQIAVSEGNSIEIVQALLEAGADVNAPPSLPRFGRVLEEAVLTGKSVEIVQALLEAGADVNVPASRYDGSVLQMAVSKGRSVEIVQALLEAGASPNAPTDWQHPRDTPLQIAAKSGSVENFRMLLSAGARVHAPASVSDSRLLVTSAEAGSVEIVRMLLDAGAEVNARTKYDPDSGYNWHSLDRFDLTYGFTALQVAARGGRVEIAQMLLDAGADVKAPENSPLPWAARAGPNGYSIAQALLGAGADVNAMDCHDRTALEVAIHEGQDALVQDLLDAGADVNNFSESNPRTALGAAVKRNNIILVQKLLDAGAKADVVHFPLKNPPALKVSDVVHFSFNNLPACEASDIVPLAAKQGNIGIIQLLIKAGADVNAGHQTALQEAAYSGNTELVQILLDAGADINAPPYKRGGRTTLQAAVIEGHTELARRLIKVGADVNAPAAEMCGMTALQGAAIKGHLGIASALIEAGADPNAPPAKYQGRTALEGAAEHGRLDMVGLLLNAGADISGLKRAGELAKRNNHFVVAQFLKEFHKSEVDENATF